MWSHEWAVEDSCEDSFDFFILLLYITLCLHGIDDEGVEPVWDASLVPLLNNMRLQASLLFASRSTYNKNRSTPCIELRQQKTYWKNTRASPIAKKPIVHVKPASETDHAINCHMLYYYANNWRH